MPAKPSTPKPPPATLVISFSPVRWPEVVRVVEVRQNQTLNHLAQAVIEQFELERPDAWRFFLTGRAWERAGERRSDDAGAKATVVSAGLAVGARPLFMAVDAGERWYRAEVVRAAEAEPAAKYPRVIESRGELPDPFDAFGGIFGESVVADDDDARTDDDDLDDGDDGDEDDGDEGDEGDADEGDAVSGADEPDEPATAPTDPEALALAAETELAVSEYDEHFERDDAADAPRPRARVVRDLALAQRICARFGDDAQTFGLWATSIEATVEEWLGMLPFDLEDHALRDEAVALCAELAKLLDPAELLMDRAMLLGRGGRKDEARAQTEAALDEYPEVYDVRARGATVLLEIGDVARAEDLARSVFDAPLEGVDVALYDDAIAVLDAVYRASGRVAEADALASSEQATRAANLGEDDGEGGDMLDALTGLLGGAGAGDGLPAVRSEPPRERRRSKP